MTNRKGFTLLELLISIVLVVIIVAAVYFAINGAFDSWAYCRDQLGLQKVLAETMDKVINGSVTEFGLKDSMETVMGGKTRIEFVPPWIDNTHSSAGRDFIYTLNAPMKSGSAVPIGEIKMPETDRWRLVPVQVVPSDSFDITQVRLGLSVPEGSDLRFVFFPDKVRQPSSVHKIFWDQNSKEILFEYADHVESLSKNYFGVEVLNFGIRFFTNNNDELPVKDWLDSEDLDSVTGLEVTMEARLGDQTQKLVRFVNLRNAPLRTGYLTLRKGMKVRVPDSTVIKTFLITNLSGINNNDELVLEAVPQAGKVWRASFQFEQIGSQKPVVRKIAVEYPERNTIYTEFPRTTTDLGINLLLLDAQGLYDYDDDSDVDDSVLLEGNVDLYIKEMDIAGAGLFVRP